MWLAVLRRDSSRTKGSATGAPFSSNQSDRVNASGTVSRVIRSRLKAQFQNLQGQIDETRAKLLHELCDSLGGDA